MWEKLITLDTLFWYCDGPKPTIAACRYNIQIRQCKSVTQYIYLFIFLTLDLCPLCAEMDAARRKAHIKQQAALKKQQEGQTLKGMGSSNQSTKRK